MIRPGQLPEICPRPAHWTEIPTNAGRIRDLAEDNGWATEIVYARGAGLGPRVVDLIVVRLQRDRQWMVAIFHDGRFDSAVQLAPLRKHNSRELKAVLEAPGGLDPEPEVPQVPAEPRQELREEYEVLGYYLTDHPLEYVNRGRYSSVIDALSIVDDEDHRLVDEPVELLGIVEEPQTKRTRKTQTLMGFFSLSDLSAAVPCFTFGEDNCGQLKPGDVIHAKGVVTERDGDLSVKVLKIREVSW